MTQPTPPTHPSPTMVTSEGGRGAKLILAIGGLINCTLLVVLIVILVTR